MDKERKFGQMEVNMKATGHMVSKMEKEKNKTKNKDSHTLEVGLTAWKVDTERKLGTMDQYMKENGKMMHNKAKDNSLVLIKESTQEVGEIINYMVTENLHGPMEKSSQVNMNSI